MTFWIVTSFMALAVCLLIAMVLLRARSLGEPAAAYDLKVYRQQLRELDKDLARGVIKKMTPNALRLKSRGAFWPQMCSFKIISPVWRSPVA